MSDSQKILDFWFGGLLDKPDSEAVMQRWFSVDESQDADIRQRFGSLLETAEAGGLTEWENTPESQLALIVLLDQFSRNLYRGSAKAFANDARAVQLAEASVTQGWDQKLHPLQRLFIYLPFEHSEDLKHQDMAVTHFEQLSAEAPVEQRKLYDMLLDYAQRHRDVIVRFGRFPHRNQRLNRQNTPEEAQFLQEPGSSFG